MEYLLSVLCDDYDDDDDDDDDDCDDEHDEYDTKYNDDDYL